MHMRSHLNHEIQTSGGTRALYWHLGTKFVLAILMVYLSKLGANTPHTHANVHEIILDPLGRGPWGYLPYIESNKGRDEL